MPPEFVVDQNRHDTYTGAEMSTSSRATVGIIGAGNIGQAFARLTSHASRNAIISNNTARHP